MRLRLLAFLPLAGLITLLLLSSAASLVSALESSVVGGASSSGPMPVTKYETPCDALVRQLHALSHEVSHCGEATACGESPLLCPAALDEEIDQTYRRLRTALHAQCGFPLRLIDFAWDGPGGGSEPRPTGSASANVHPEEPLHFVDATCGERHDWLESAARGEAEPTRYSF